MSNMESPPSISLHPTPSDPMTKKSSERRKELEHESKMDAIRVSRAPSIDASVYSSFSSSASQSTTTGALVSTSSSALLTAENTGTMQRRLMASSMRRKEERKKERSFNRSQKSSRTASRAASRPASAAPNADGDNEYSDDDFEDDGHNDIEAMILEVESEDDDEDDGFIFGNKKKRKGGKSSQSGGSGFDLGDYLDELESSSDGSFSDDEDGDVMPFSFFASPEEKTRDDLSTSPSLSPETGGLTSLLTRRDSLKDLDGGATSFHRRGSSGSKTSFGGPKPPPKKRTSSAIEWKDDNAANMKSDSRSMSPPLPAGDRTAPTSRRGSKETPLDDNKLPTRSPKGMPPRHSTSFNTPTPRNATSTSSFSFDDDFSSEATTSQSFAKQPQKKMVSSAELEAQWQQEILQAKMQGVEVGEVRGRTMLESDYFLHITAWFGASRFMVQENEEYLQDIYHPFVAKKALLDDVFAEEREEEEESPVSSSKYQESSPSRSAYKSSSRSQSPDDRTSKSVSRSPSYASSQSSRRSSYASRSSVNDSKNSESDSESVGPPALDIEKVTQVPPDDRPEEDERALMEGTAASPPALTKTVAPHDDGTDHSSQPASAAATPQNKTRSRGASRIESKTAALIKLEAFERQELLEDELFMWQDGVEAFFEEVWIGKRLFYKWETAQRKQIAISCLKQLLPIKKSYSTFLEECDFHSEVHHERCGLEITQRTEWRALLAKHEKHRGELEVGFKETMQARKYLMEREEERRAQLQRSALAHLRSFVNFLDITLLHMLSRKNTVEFDEKQARCQIEVQWLDEYQFAAFYDNELHDRERIAATRQREVTAMSRTEQRERHSAASLLDAVEFEQMIRKRLTVEELNQRFIRLDPYFEQLEVLCEEHLIRHQDILKNEDHGWQKAIIPQFFREKKKIETYLLLEDIAQQKKLLLEEEVEVREEMEYNEVDTFNVIGKQFREEKSIVNNIDKLSAAEREAREHLERYSLSELQLMCLVQPIFREEMATRREIRRQWKDDYHKKIDKPFRTQYAGIYQAVLQLQKATSAVNQWPASEELKRRRVLNEEATAFRELQRLHFKGRSELQERTDAFMRRQAENNTYKRSERHLANSKAIIRHTKEQYLWFRVFSKLAEVDEEFNKKEQAWAASGGAWSKMKRVKTVGPEKKKKRKKKQEGSASEHDNGQLVVQSPTLAGSMSSSFKRSGGPTSPRRSTAKKKVITTKLVAVGADDFNPVTPAVEHCPSTARPIGGGTFRSTLDWGPPVPKPPPKQPRLASATTDRRTQQKERLLLTSGPQQLRPATANNDTLPTAPTRPAGQQPAAPRPLRQSQLQQLQPVKPSSAPSGLYEDEDNTPKRHHRHKGGQPHPGSAIASTSTRRQHRGRSPDSSKKGSTKRGVSPVSYSRHRSLSSSSEGENDRYSPGSRSRSAASHRSSPSRSTTPLSSRPSRSPSPSTSSRATPSRSYDSRSTSPQSSSYYYTPSRSTRRQSTPFSDYTPQTTLSPSYCSTTPGAQSGYKPKRSENQPSPLSFSVSPSRSRPRHPYEEPPRTSPFKVTSTTATPSRTILDFSSPQNYHRRQEQLHATASTERGVSPTQTSGANGGSTIREPASTAATSPAALFYSERAQPLPVVPSVSSEQGTTSARESEGGKKKVSKKVKAKQLRLASLASVLSPTAMATATARDRAPSLAQRRIKLRHQVGNGSSSSAVAKSPHH